MIRNRLKNILLYTMLLMLACLPAAYGQDLTISAQVNPTQAAVGQQLRLTVTIEGKVNVRGNPELPDLPAFQVFGGGRSSNFSFVNGKVSSALTFTYALVAQQAGQFTIGPIKIAHDNKIYSTKPINVTITSAGGGQRSPSSRAVQPKQMQRQALPSNQADQNKALFITTEVDKKNGYVNEPFTLTFRFYRRIALLSQPQYTPPTANGFWSEDLPPQRNYVTNINGVDYEVTEIKTALFPTTAGELTISPAGLTAMVRSQNRRSHDPFGDSFFDGFFSRGQQVELESKPITVNVKPVPTEGRPADFTGTVGSWSMSAKLDRKKAKTGDAVTLEVRLFGEGNVKSVGKPRLPALTGFKMYETVSSSEVQKQDGRVRGVKIYRTLLRPEVTGRLTIPSITYSYFNPKKHQFESISVPPLKLDVTQGTVESPVQGMGGVQSAQPAGPGVKVIAKDIRYLKTNIDLKSSDYGQQSLVWLIGFTLPPVILAFIWFWSRHQIRLTEDPRYARKLAANKSARKIFKNAHQARLKKDTKQFYSSLSAALSGYLADRLGYSRSGITQREIVTQLKQRQAAPELIEQLTALLDECDYASFAPGERDSRQMEKHEQEAEHLLVAVMKLLSQEKAL